MRKVLVTLVMLSALQVSAGRKNKHVKSCNRPKCVYNDTLNNKYDCNPDHTIKNGWDTIVGKQSHR